MTTLLDGKKARDHYKKALVTRIKELSSAPKLALIQVGDNAESSIYIEQKKKFAKSIGARVEHVRFPENAPASEIADKIEALNADEGIHGIIIQLPLPEIFDKLELINLISPEKDVDGLTDENQMLLEQDDPRFVPATAKGVFLLLDFYKVRIAGVRAVVFGRSRLVGHPIAEILRAKGAEVSVCHSKTVDAKGLSMQADLVIVAIGKPQSIDASYIKRGAVVVDVGINSIEGNKLEEEIPKRKVVGDVNFDEVSKIAKAISPVPGGVGPMTVLALFDNLISSAERCS
jgi:methylenetetrahydrofolate dehydrogenase (NADP+) / methenyltetrahydrofolate cyclohydrolase